MKKRKDYFKLFFVRDFAYSIIVPGPYFTYSRSVPSRLCCKSLRLRHLRARGPC